MLKPYSKPPLSYHKQVERLISRGLTIDSPSQAEKFLHHVSYYRYSAYRIPFQKEWDVFIPGTSFEQIRRLYELDEDLRDAFSHVLTAIEIFLRTHMTHELIMAYNAFAHYERSLFRDSFNHEQWINSLEIEIGRARETFIKHFKTTYAGFPKLPLWVATEVMSLGNLSKMYGGLLPVAQRKISLLFDVHHVVLRNWLHVITYIRNNCAHHSRLWNRELAIRPDIPRKNLQWKKQGLNNTRIYASAAVLEWIVRKAEISPSLMEPIYATMKKITEQDKRFGRYLGLSENHNLGFFWVLIWE